MISMTFKFYRKHHFAGFKAALILRPQSPYRRGPVDASGTCRSPGSGQQGYPCQETDKRNHIRPILSAGRARLPGAAAATAFSELLGLSRTIRSLQKHNMTGKRAYVLAAEEDQNDTCEDQMNALFEFLTTEPAICPTA